MIHPEIRKGVKRLAGPLEALATQIHDNPELAFNEKKACAWQVALLKKWTFQVEAPFGGLTTAYRARWGSGRPAFCFIAEYDALPQIGHACGHNLICAAAIGAAIALRDVLKQEKIRGTVVILGTPGEESGGGKLIMIKNGALKAIDAAIEAHPSSRTVPYAGHSAIRSVQVDYTGKASHAAGAPEKGLNALDAVMLLFQGVNAWRQHLVETSRIHGIVTDGGVAPNIIPDHASCLFFLRSMEDDDLTRMIGRFRDIAQGAALMTGTQARIRVAKGGYRSGNPNARLNEFFVQAAAATGLRPEIPEKSGRGSSDFGDVSHEVPGAHVYFRITKNSVAGHSVAFARAAGSAYGKRQMLRAAEAIANVGYRFFTDAAFREQVRDAFEHRGGKNTWP
ncbi:MAG: amidohydrolase [Kiritimatiellae bacterium]|nr:amidohydrolase [Kiritimatiellia bacterium]